MQEEKSYSLENSENAYADGMSDADKVRKLDPVRRAIWENAEKLNIDLAELSRRVGRNHAYFQQFIWRSTAPSVPEQIRSKTAEILRLDEGLLRGESTPKLKGVEIPRNARVGDSFNIAGTVPLYGQAMAGRDGRFVLNGNKVTDIMAPPALQKVKGAYAVYIVGDSMENRYFAGEVVFVNPMLPVRQGDFVVAQIATDAEGEAPDAYVKRFVSQDAVRLRLEQYKPKKVIEFDTKRVVSVHRIIMGGEG